MFTGTRADFGPLYWVVREIMDEEALDLQLLVSGTHHSLRHGRSRDLIEAEGIPVHANIEVLVDSDTSTAAATTLGLCISKVADVLERSASDVLVVLGDRYEALGAALAAVLCRVPVAHLHGGEVTAGAMDERFRHAITKLAAIHLVAAAPFRQRILQLGEHPGCVFVVGAPGLDHIRRTPLPDRTELHDEVGFPLEGPVLLVTYHPPTAEPDRALSGVTALLEALDAVPGPDIVFTGSNADVDAGTVESAIRRFVEGRPRRCQFQPSLGHRRYLAAVRVSSAVVGNSSSGIIEAPALGVPTVNVGDRQEGRLRATSTIDVKEEAGAIATAIEKALSRQWQQLARNTGSPYGDGRTAERVVRILREAELPLLKTFVDLTPWGER